MIFSTSKSKVRHGIDQAKKAGGHEDSEDPGFKLKLYHTANLAPERLDITRALRRRALPRSEARLGRQRKRGLHPNPKLGERLNAPSQMFAYPSFGLSTRNSVLPLLQTWSRTRSFFCDFVAFGDCLVGAGERLAIHLEDDIPFRSPARSRRNPARHR